MPALTHGRVVNGFNAYSMNYKIIKKKYRESSTPYGCNNSKHPNSNKSSTDCEKKNICTEWYNNTIKISEIK